MRSFNSLYKGLALGLSLFALSLGNVYCGSSSGGSSGGGGNGGNKTTLEVSIDNDSYLRGEQVCVNGTASGTKDFGWDPNPEVGFAGLTGTLNDCFTLSYDSPLALQTLTAYAGSLERSVNFTPLNNPPVANLSCSSGTAGDIPVSADGTNSHDVDDGIKSCSWDWADGSSYTETTISATDGSFDCNTDHTFSSPGLYDITLTVGDGYATSQAGCTAMVNLP